MESSRESSMDNGHRPEATILAKDSTNEDHHNISAGTGSSSSETFLKFSVLGFGVGLVFGGFALGLGRTKKSPDFSLAPVEGLESPSRLALRALGWGTVIAITSVYGPILAFAYYSGASNPKEFGDKIKKFFGAKF